MEKPLQTLHKALLANKYDVPESYDDFEYTLSLPGDEGYQNRHQLWKSLKENDFDVPDNYEDFSGTLFVPKQPQRKKGMIANTVNTENGMTFTEAGFDSLQNGAKPVYTGSSSEAEAEAEPQPTEPIDLSKPEEYQIPKPFVQGAEEARQMADSPELNKQWAQRQAMAAVRSTKPDVYNFGDRMYSLEMAQQADAARQMKRGEYDKQNAEKFYQEHVAPAFAEERAAGEERAKKAVQDAEAQLAERALSAPQTVAGATSNFGSAFQTAVNVERETDPAKIAAATIKRVQNDDAFGDYVLSRMGISGNTADNTGAGESELLSDREKKYMQLLFATETNEVADQMIQRIYDQYKAEGAPKSALDYIAGKAFHENFVTSLFDAMVRRVANSSGMREQLRAMASEEYGQDVSWLTRAAGAAAPFAVDMLTGGFAAPTAVGNALVKGGMRMAAKEVTREMGKRAAARGLKDAALEEAVAGGAGVAERYLATQAPILNFALRSAGSAANFATYDVQSEAVRQLAEGEFNAGNLIKQAVHGATLGGVLGVTGGVIANATRNSGLAKKVLADIAGVGAETGIFAAANGIEKAHQLGIDIADVDWADTTGEALGMVLGMKTVGAVTHPKEFLKRYQQSKDLGMQLNQRDIDELKQAGYNFDSIFKGLGEFGKIAPESATIRRGAAEYTEDATGKRGQRNTETTEAYVDTDAFDAVMRNPEISSSLKRKVAFIATGKVLSLEPVFGASIDVDDNGKVTITTKNVYGNPIESKEYDSVEQAQQEFQLMQETARANTIGGLERIADKTGYQDVVDTAKGRTEAETGVDVDNLDKLSELTTEEANGVLDAYIKNLQDAYMERFNENLERIGDAPAGEATGTGGNVGGLPSDGRGTTKTERRQAAYERGASVAGDESQLPGMSYEGKLAEARMMALMPDGDQAGYTRQQVTQALEQGDVEAAERILQQQSPYLSAEQREAVDAYIDTYEMRQGIDDAVEQAITDYEQAKREQIMPLADPQGNVTALRLKDDSVVYFQSGDMNGFHSTVFVTDENGNTKQIDSSEIAQVEYVRPADEMITEAVDAYGNMVAQRYNGLADGSILMDGQEADMVMGNQIFHVTALGQDEQGNTIVQMEDGSRMAMTPEQMAEAIDAADMLKIQELLAQEKNAAAEQQRTLRFSKGIVGYAEGTPDLTNKDTKPDVAAEYLLSQTDANGQPVDRRQVLSNIQQEIDKANEKKLQALQQIQQARNDMAMTEEGDDVYKQAELTIRMLEPWIADVDSWRKKWGEIRQAMMTDEERQAFEKDRIKEISKAKSQSKIVAPEGTPAWMATMPTKEQVVEKYPERRDGEAFVEEQRKQLSQMYRQDVYPKYDDIQKQLGDYQHGLIDLTPDEVKALTDLQANLSMRMTEMVNEMNAWKKLSTDLARAYTVSERQNMTPHEQAMAKLAGETDKAKKLKLAQEAFKDDPVALSYLDNMEPQDVYEYIAENLGAHSINWEGLKRGEHEVRGLIKEMGKDKKRGVGAGYDTNGYNYFLAPTGQGKGIDEIIHDLYEGSPYRDDEVRNALLTMLKEAEKPTDISHRVIDDRIAQAEQIYEQNRERERDLEEEAQRQAEDEAIMQMTGMTHEEYDAYISDLEQRLAQQEGYQNSEEYFNQLANEYDRTNERRAGGSQEESTLVVQGQEGKQTAAEAEGQGGARENDAELAAKHLQTIKDGVDLYLKKYRTLAPLEMVDINSDEQLAKIVGDVFVEDLRKYLKKYKVPALYDTENKKIYIFAEYLSPENVEEAIFHENIHRGLDQYYGNGLREVSEAFWNTESSTNPEATAKHKAAIQERYQDEPDGSQHEEYLVHVFAHQMATGKVDNLFPRLSPEHQEIIDNILHNIGYDRAKEATQRRGQQGSNGADKEEVPAAVQESGPGGRVSDQEDNSFPARLAAAKEEVNTQPTEEQKKAGNYKMGHISFGGYQMSIENPKGSVRSGVDANGKPWSIEMQDTYGYIGKKYGTDGDHLDFFINDDADLDSWNGRVYVVDQKNEDGTFDEHKVMYGYPSYAAAKRAYMRNYEPGWWDKRVMQMTGVRKSVFDKWLEDSDHKTKPFAEYSRTRQAETVSNNMEQLMADVEERKNAKHAEPAGETAGVVEAGYKAGELEAMSIDELKQARKKRRADASTARLMLGTIDKLKNSDKGVQLQNRIAQASADIAAIDKEIAKKSDLFRQQVEQQEIGGAMVDQLENMGFDVSTNPSEMRQARKKAEKDNSEEGKLRHFETSDGKIYGFVYKGKMYLDPRKIDANLPIHEYAHPWCEAFRKLNPEGWKSIVDVMRSDKDTWEFVKALNPDLKNDDDIAEEMIAKGSGEAGQKYAQAEYERMNQRDPNYKSKWGNIWKNISKAIQDFWKAVGDFLHIKYESAEQVYGQVVRDFANKMNPRKRVEQWLQERDKTYIDAVNKGDMKQAKELFDAALRENIGNGITPYIAVEGYRKMRPLAHAIKERDPKVIAKVADMMAPLIPKDAVLVPAPSHSGKATDMLDLANAISERTGAPVADVLTSGERPSQYEAKYAGKPIASSEMGIVAATEQLPADKLPVVIDNVVDTGNTAEACVQALGKGIVASLADSVENRKHVSSLKSAEPVVTDKNGNIVPLSDRFQFMIEEGSLFSDEDFEEPAGAAVVMDMHGFNLNSPLGKRLAELKEQAGENGLVGYTSDDGYVFVGDSTKVIDKLNAVKGVVKGERDGMQILTVPESLFDKVSPKLVKDGYKMAFLSTPDVQLPGKVAEKPAEDTAGVVEPQGAVETVLKEVERRKEVAADKKVANETVEKYLKKMPQKTQNEKVRVRATKAVLTAMDNAKVPYKVVSKEEEKQMLQIFSMMNQEPIKDFARSPYMRATSPHGRRGRYIIYDMSNPYGVPMYFEKLSTAKYGLENMRRLVPEGTWEIMDIGNPEDVAKAQTTKQRKAAEYYELMQMMGGDKKTSASATALGEKSPLKDAVVTDSDFAKVQNNLETLAKNTEKISNEEKNRFISLLAKAVGAKKRGSNSQYVTIEAKNGTVVTLRLADHNVTVSNFDYSEEPNGVSIVISRKPNAGVTNDGNAHIVEYFYPDKELRKADGSPYSEIVKSVEQMLYSGEYKDTTGIAQPEEVNNPLDLQADIETWHGTGYTFTKFDHSNMGKGAGSQVFGWGTYLTSGEKIAEDYANSVAKKKYNDETPGYNGKEVLYKGEKIDLDQSKLDPLRLAYDTLNSEGTIKKAVTFVERLMDYAEEQDMKDTWQEVLDILKNSKKSDFKVRNADLTDKRLLYKVDIPEDTGDNYLDWMTTIKKPLRRKIADAVRQLDGEPQQSFIFTNYKNGWESLADMIEREPFAYKEIHDRLLMAFGGRVKDAEKVSKLMNSLGFVGVKYPAGTIWGGGDGATNYVIFNEDNAKIVQTISFMWGDEPAAGTVAPVFISNALKAAEDIKQEKATPEQWLAMLQKNGGLKAGEDKWLGLSDWLKQQKGSVTKQDLLDYIRKNQIQIEEVPYQEYFDVDNLPKMQEFRKEYKQLYDKYDKERNAINDEMERFNQEMYEKYGQGWANDLKKLSDEERKRYSDITKRYDFLNDNDIEQLAFGDMVDRYGDDFSMAFEVNYGNNKLEPQMDMYGDEISDAAKHFLEFDVQPINSTRLGYTTNGLENKREIALTVPTIESWNEGDQIHFGDAGNGRAVAWVRFGDAYYNKNGEPTEVDSQWDAFMSKMAKKYGKDRQDTLGLLTEMTDEERETMNKLDKQITEKEKRNMGRVLVIDEIQSKRHQEGREKGYKGDVQKSWEDSHEANKVLNDYLRELKQKYGTSDIDQLRELSSPEEMSKLEELRLDYEDKHNIFLRDKNAIPDAPFEKNWHELAMKRMLRYAAENGYDKVAWTTGKQQADRYNIGNVANSVLASDWQDFSKFADNAKDCKMISIYNNDNAIVEAIVNRDGKIVKSPNTGFVDKNLAEVVGKEMAIKLLADGNQKLEGEDLRIGAEGMKGFYDDMLVRFMNKYGKKWGVKVGEVELPDLEKSAQKMWSIDVTPEMKESVMQGQPMFQKEGKKLLGWSDGKLVYLTKDGLNPNTPLHETTHLWDNWCMKEHPDLWQKLVAAMKKTAMWEEVASNPNYRNIWNDENRMASEVHARLSGAAGEDEFMKAAFKKNTPQSIINEVKNALRKFWEAVLRLFGKHTKTIGDDWTSLDAIIRMPLRDLLNQDFEKVMKAAGEDAVSSGDLSLMNGDILLKTLMGVHNISEEKLKKALKQGGLANPSLAVFDTRNYSHTDYGEISLIPRATLVDSKTGRNAGTYSGDAWTPTYPGVENFLTKKGEKHLKAIAKEAAGGDAEMERHLIGVINDYVEGNGDRMHFLFLKQKGLNPEVMQERTTHSKEEFDAITKIFGEPMSTMPSDLTEEQRTAMLDLVVSAQEKKIKESAADIKDEEKREKYIKSRVESYRDRITDDDGRLYFAPGDEFVYGNWRDEKRRQNPQPDWHRTDNEANYRVAKEGLSEEYAQWKEQLLDDEDIEEKLFAGWTPDGTKRYVKNTVENASRLMNKEADTNAYGNGGVNASKSVLLKKLKSLSEIRKYRHLLMNDEQVKEWQKETEDEWFSIIQRVSDMQKIDSNRFINIDIAEARLQEAMTMRDPIGYLNKEYGYDIDKDSELASDLMNFMEKAKESPVKYFETKFKRPVGIEEFAVAIVPTTTSPEVVKALKDAGLEVHTYERSSIGDANDQNRINATMNAVGMRNDILFHIEDDPETVKRLDREPKEVGYRNVVMNADGTLGSPMANRLGKKGEERKATTPFEYGKWERSDEHPELANEQGKIDLIKPDGKPVGGVDYNPYIHIRPNKVNKQFKQAWERPNLIYVETEYPKSELNGDYRAIKAAKSVGKHKWGTQGEYLILSRWDKPVRMVPWEEVANDWVKEFEGTDGINFDIIPPKLLPILAERGMKILPPHKGMGKDCQEAYKEWKDEHDIMRSKGKKLAAHDTTGFADVAEAAGEALGGVKVNAVTSADADAKLKAEIENGTKGIYDPNTHTVTLLLDNIEDAADAVRTVFHEKLGHEGLVDLLGSQEAVDKFGSFVFKSAKNDIRNRILAKADEIDPEWKDGARYSKAAQEILADIAEEGPKTADEFDLWTKVKHYLIALLNKLGMKIRGLLNDKDLAYYIVKTGAALKKWNQMSETERADLAAQATSHDIMRSVNGKPRQKKGESMAQYFQRLKEWEKWREARKMAKENGDPEPKEEDFHEQAEAEYKQAMQEWMDDNGITDAAGAGTFPKRQEGETPQEYAVRVAQYESDKDMWSTAPKLMDYLRRANDKYRAAYTAWRERYDLQEELTVDQRIYEGAVEPQPTFTDAEQEAQYLAEKDLADAEGFEIDEEGAKRMAKLAVIERRKDFESANAEDAIWVYDFVKKSDAVAKELSARIPDATGKELRAALPFLIEADRRRENLEAERENAVMEVNMNKAIQQAHSFIDYYNMDAIEDELKALNDAWDYKEKHPTGDAQQAYREAAARLAEKLNELNKDKAGYNKLFADDIMQIRSLLNHASVTGRGEVMPEWAKKYEGVPEVQQLMEHIKSWYDEFYQVLEDAGLRGDAGFIDDGYVNHVWDKEKSDPKAWEQYIENRQRTKSPNMRHREIDTYMDGISIGLVPKYTDIADMIAHYSRQNNEAVANSHFLDDLKFVVVQEMNDEGEVKAILPLLMTDKPDGLLRDKYAQYYVPGVGDVYVLKHIQKRFANIFGTMRTPDAAQWLSNLGKGYDIISSTAKKIQLALSGFHALALWEVDIAQNGPVDALKHLAKYIIVDSIKGGALPAYTHPEDFQLAAKHLVQLGATEDYAAADVNAITKKMREFFKGLQMDDAEWKKAAGTVGSPAAIFMDWINQGFDTVLWNYLHDGLKLCAFKELAGQVDRRVADKGLDEDTRERMLDEAGQYVNDMFGGQYWELINISPATLKWMRRFFLSPDWLVSTQRHFFANFGFGSIYSDGGFREYVKYNWDNIQRLFGKDVATNELRRLRSRNAKICYLIGAIVWFGMFYNAINALMRWMDEKDEKAKADEQRKTNPNYKSPYELAYPDGMKWYDYTMYGNAVGQQTHLFTGRYSDGTETYVRWGKQFREFPELFIGRHGVEFPSPLIQRMMSKANPNIGTVIDFLGAQNIGGFNGSYENKELREKYGKTVATLAAMSRHFIPFGMPTQTDKEYKWLDFFMPSSKGFSNYKAKDYFETFIMDGDWNGIEATYNACVMNGIDAEKALDAAIASIKATQRREMTNDVTDLSSAALKFDAAAKPEERKALLNNLKKHLKGSEYKVMTREEAIEKVHNFIDGDGVDEKENIRYIMLATSEDIIAEEKLKDLGRTAKKFKQELDAAKGTDKYAEMKERYGSWLRIGKKVNKATRAINKEKKRLGHLNEDEIMEKIRETVRKTQAEIEEIQAPN